MKLLITGGAGFIGSHTCVSLLRAGHELQVVDDLSNGHIEAVRRASELADGEIVFHRVDLLDEPTLRRVFEQFRPEGVIHFAGRKAVGESVANPLLYWRVNVGGAIHLLQAMQDYGCRTLVFSSSATVYGQPESLPLREDAPLHPTCPYGQTKLAIERLCEDVAATNPNWRISLLRYFNPVGAHPSGRLGEDPAGEPANLMPYVAQVAAGRRPEVAVFGNEWPTPDGTGVRDYLHVMDLAEGHARALEFLRTHPGLHVHNLGTGQGYSVLEVIAAFAGACGHNIPCRWAPRRPGDIPSCWADPTRANEELGWRATRTLADMCADAWRWQQQNPTGYTEGSE